MTTNEKIKNIWGDGSINPFNQFNFWKNFKSKMSESSSKKQFNVAAEINIYQEEINPNETHRGIAISKHFCAFSIANDESAPSKFSSQPPAYKFFRATVTI